MPEHGLKVSVIVATYCSGSGLDRLVASLDAQTLPFDEWEAIFVDDGSPDDTFDRLNVLATARPNFRAVRIENSGWPCRPRNVGIDMADGEYVAFMDHDDELYPDALRDGYDFAARNGADILNGKEARTTDAGWAIEEYAQDLPQALGLGLLHSVVAPTNPHKLYRRALLDQHGIRFREGGRVLWEDIFFNVAVLKHAEVVSTMASTPYYHWFTTAGSGSTTFRRARPEWWRWLDEVIIAIDEDLAEESLSVERLLLRRHQYRSRLIESFNNYYVQRESAPRKLIFEQARQLQSSYFSPEDDECLDVSGRLRAQLLRAGHPHAIDRLIRADPAVGPHPQARSVTWHDGVLHVDVAVDWRAPGGGSPTLRARHGRLIKDLPQQFDRIFNLAQLDMTDEIAAATVAVGVRSVESRLGWLVPSVSTVWQSSEASPAFGVNASGAIDPARVALGTPMETGVWDVTARCRFGSLRSQPRIRSSLAPAIRVDAAGAHAAYTNSGRLVLEREIADLASLIRPTGRTRVVGGARQIEVEVDETGPDAAELTVNVSVRAASSAARQLLKGIRPGIPWRSVSVPVRAQDGKLWMELPDSRADLLIRLGARRPEGEHLYRVSADSVREVSQWTGR